MVSLAVFATAAASALSAATGLQRATEKDFWVDAPASRRTRTLPSAPCACWLRPSLWQRRGQRHGRQSFAVGNVCCSITSNAGAPRLVLVENNDNMRSAIKRFLEERGFRCAAFEDGASALHSMSLELPDLVVSDVLMPKMDGYELLQRLRSDRRLCGLPVILLTARGMTADRVAGYNAGASVYISKPFDPEELLAVINAQLRNANLARASLIQDEMQDLKKDVSSIRGLLQLLLLKSQSSDQSVEAAVSAAPRLLMQLGQRASEESLALVAPQSPSTPPLPKLTMRERSVLELVGEGLLNKEIAQRLNVSKSHIEKYVRRLLIKTQTFNRTELVRKSLKLGLLTDGENGLSSPASPTPRLTANSSPSLRAAEEDEAGGWPERESGVGR